MLEQQEAQEQAVLPEMLVDLAEAAGVELLERVMQAMVTQEDKEMQE